MVTKAIHIKEEITIVGLILRFFIIKVDLSYKCILYISNKKIYYKFLKKIYGETSRLSLHKSMRFEF